MISNGTPPILPPRCSLASSTERRMSSPIAACGPEKVLMKPILIGACAAAGRAKASAAIVAVPNNLVFMILRSLLPSPSLMGLIKAENTLLNKLATELVALDLSRRRLGQFGDVLDPARILVGR